MINDEEYIGTHITSKKNIKGEMEANSEWFENKEYSI